MLRRIGIGLRGEECRWAMDGGADETGGGEGCFGSDWLMGEIGENLLGEGGAFVRSRTEEKRTEMFAK